MPPRRRKPERVLRWDFAPEPQNSGHAPVPPRSGLPAGGVQGQRVPLGGPYDRGLPVRPQQSPG
eukprot:12757512-Alexandrium_andersonii.AAC.1